MESNAFDINNSFTRRLIEEHVFSRIAERDTSLFDFSPETAEYASRYFGWTHLAADPPVDPGQIAAFAAMVRAEGLRSVVLR